MKYAVVTGATGGIGTAVAQRLRAAGYHLLLLGKTREKCLALHQDLLREPGCGLYIDSLAVDLTADDAPVRLQDILSALRSPPTLLVTCHGHTPLPTLAFQSYKAAEQVWRCDVQGTLLVCQAVGQTMAQGLGHRSMVLLSSLHAHATYPARVPYAMAKSAIVAMARALAVELGQYGITVNALSPWQVQNTRTEAVAQTEDATHHGVETMELYRRKSPLRRLVQPDDIAEAVLMLAQNQSITGQDLIIDCGVRASLWHRPFLMREFLGQEDTYAV